jgi:hypothetical protein
MPHARLMKHFAFQTPNGVSPLQRRLEALSHSGRLSAWLRVRVLTKCLTTARDQSCERDRADHASGDSYLAPAPSRSQAAAISGSVPASCSGGIIAVVSRPVEAEY